jgi:hypothetical protein
MPFKKTCDIMEDLHMFAIKDKNKRARSIIIKYQDTATEETLSKLLCTRRSTWYTL